MGCPVGGPMPPAFGDDDPDTVARNALAEIVDAQPPRAHF